VKSVLVKAFPGFEQVISEGLKRSGKHFVTKMVGN